MRKKIYNTCTLAVYVELKIQSKTRDISTGQIKLLI